MGDTLVEYEGVPLNWEAHYPEALANLALSLNISPGRRHIDDACAILRRHNTRIYPREVEVSFASILEQILRALEFSDAAEELPCATAFFRVFRKTLRCFPDTTEALASLRDRKIKIGVFTDVPYGMPRELVVEDVRGTGIDRFLDALITSRDVGFRKPSSVTLRLLAEALGCEAHEMIYVGNERKDVEVARAYGCRAFLIDRAKHGYNWGQERTVALLSEI